MGQSGEDGDERIPTYEESMRQTSSQQSNNPSGSEKLLSGSQRQPLSHVLANTRSERVHAIISTYIAPLLESQALSGLYKTTIVLVPSNSSSLQTSKGSPDIIEGSGESIAHDSAEAVVGFPDEDYVKLVRLHGEEYATEFWRQPAVISELETSLKARLAASGHSMEGANEDTNSNPAPPPGSRSMPPKAKMGLFRRKMKDKAPSEQPGTSSARSQSASSSALKPGAVRLKIALEDVSMRVVTDMGLYETKSGKALVVNLEIGS